MCRVLGSRGDSYPANEIAIALFSGLARIASRLNVLALVEASPSPSRNTKRCRNRQIPQ